MNRPLIFCFIFMLAGFALDFASTWQCSGFQPREVVTNYVEYPNGFYQKSSYIKSIREDNRNVAQLGFALWGLKSFTIVSLIMGITYASEWWLRRACPKVIYLACLTPLTVGLMELMAAVNNHILLWRFLS